MKKALLGLVLVSLASLVIVSCGGGGGGGGGTDITVLGMTWSFGPYVWLMKNATINFSNHATPITGTPVTGATVTLTNETQGTSIPLTASSVSGRYVSGSGYNPNPGDKLALEIETADGTITGDPTEVSNPTYILNQSFGVRPFTLSWEVTYQGVTTYEPTHTYISVVNTSDPTIGFQRVIPISDTSIPITSAEVTTAGTYWILLNGVNSMPLNGAKSGSVVYVSGGSGGDLSFDIY